MKRLVTLLLALIMVLTMVTAFAETSSEETETSTIPFSDSFTDKLTEALEYSVEDWYSSDIQRGIIAVALIVDLMGDDAAPLDTIGYSLDDSNVKTYVALAEDQSALTVILAGTDATIMAYYQPGLSIAFYTVFESATEETSIILETALTTTNGDNWEEVSYSTLVSALSMLHEALASDD